MVPSDFSRMTDAAEIHSMAAESSITTKSLPIRTLYFRLAAQTAGWLQPWLAPALRDLIL